jgi:hypothetical protein
LPLIVLLKQQIADEWRNSRFVREDADIGAPRDLGIEPSSGLVLWICVR